MKKRILVLLIAVLMCALLCASASAERKNTAYSKLGFALDASVVENHLVVKAVTADGEETFVAEDVSEELLNARTHKGDELISFGTIIDIAFDANGKVADISKLFNLDKRNVWFDTIKYGAEFTPANGKASNVLASGWVLGKTENTVVIGDTNHFEETYTLADNARIFEMNVKDGTITESTLDALPVTEKTEGLFSLTPVRQPAIVVFDQNYEKWDEAKAIEVYYITPPSEVEEEYLLHSYDTMTLYSGNPDTAETGGVIAKPSVIPWAAHTKPFVIIPDRMVFVGDNDVNCMLFQLDEEGHYAVLDTSWPLVAYNLYQTVEEAGYDPRMCSVLLLSHGHGDHYGNANQWHEMITNAGNEVVVWESKEDTVGYADYGYEDIGPTLSDVAVIDIVDEFYQYGKWVPLGKWVRMQTFLNAGHTIGTVSYFFEVETPEGDTMTWGYIGGMGTINSAKNGYRRAQFVYFMRYAQQIYSPDYCMPQHTAHFPMCEINKAAEAAGVSYLDAVVGGNDVWVNFIEMRLDCQVYERYLAAWKENPWKEVTFLDGHKEMIEFANDKNRVTTEEAGPWKREAGEYTITLVDADFATKLIHGFDAVTQVTDAIKGVKDIYGNDLGNGIIQRRDGYVHDPNAWYIQIAMNVDDDYAGEYILEDAESGPVEKLLGEDWFELNRTLPFSSKEDAEAVMATLQPGKSYKVQMTRDSDIILAEDILQTFVPVD